MIKTEFMCMILCTCAHAEPIQKLLSQPSFWEFMCCRDIAECANGMATGPQDSYTYPEQNTMHGQEIVDQIRVCMACSMIIIIHADNWLPVIKG